MNESCPADLSAAGILPETGNAVAADFRQSVAVFILPRASDAQAGEGDHP
jgi:hypothetical protein